MFIILVQLINKSLIILTLFFSSCVYFNTFYNAKDSFNQAVKIIYNEVNQIGVPESAVTIQGNTAFVYVVNDSIVKKKNIKMGKRNFGKVSIISGVNEGDAVISEGVSKVRNKAKVKIINP